MSGARRVGRRRTRDAGSRGAAEGQRSRRHSTLRVDGERDCARGARRFQASPVARPLAARPRGSTTRGSARLDTSSSRATTCGTSSRRGAIIATVPFSGRAGRGGTVERIVLSRVQGDELVDVERWTGRDELDYALEAPIWDRFGSFAGQPLIAGTVIWTAADRRVVIEGRRGEKRFEELV